MKRLTIIWITLSVILTVSCKNSVKSTDAGVGKETESSLYQSRIYVSGNGEFRFSINDSDDDGITLVDMVNQKTYQLKHVVAASGAKYSDNDGNTFWTKGNSFIWSKNEKVITSGELMRTDFSGNYVTPDYFQRGEGYDWVAVRVKKAANNQLLFQVRSRADKKKPTCTWDATAYSESENQYYTMVEGKKVLFSFNGDTLTIAPENAADENVLYFYCSGGATVAGKYVFIEDELDPEQVDPTAFSCVLELQGIGFNISSIHENGMSKLTITPYGLEIDNRPVELEVEGSIVRVDIEDLNADGSPEVMIYTQSDGSGSYGNVIAFSVNNKKSMSRVYFPPITENTTLSKGYMGHDEFRVVENSLVQRFPIYNEGDSNANPTGGIRQISYKLVDGEASRRFEVKEIVTMK